MRKVSYPFDWIISSYDSIYNGFLDDFERFFTDLTLSDDHTGTYDYYGFDIHHIWHTKETGLAYSEPLDNIDWQAMIPQLTESFKRKMARLHAACYSGHSVVFIRRDMIDKDSAARLRDLILAKYPQLPFILMVVSYSKEFEKPWNLEHIRNYSVPYNDVEGWRKIFLQVALEFDSVN
jgi:hypothetical protein